MAAAIKATAAVAVSASRMTCVGDAAASPGDRSIDSIGINESCRLITLIALVSLGNVAFSPSSGSKTVVPAGSIISNAAAVSAAAAC